MSTSAVAPPDLVEVVVGAGHDHALIDLDDRRALGAGLPRVSALQVARVDDVGMLAQGRATMHVTEGPVVVAMVYELLKRAGRVCGVMTLTPDAGGMKQADVEEVRVGRPVLQRDVLGHLATPERSTVDHRADILDHEVLRRLVIEEGHVV